MADMDEHKTSGAGNADGHGRSDRPLGRGLEDVSHLFLSQRVPEPERSSPPPTPRGGVTLLRAASVSKERLAGVLREFAGALEDGLKPIDANIPCHPCGEIDLLAMSRSSQLTIIDADTTANDSLLLRGMGHFDWVVRNMPNLRRMYREHAVNFSFQPRLVLLAPQFSVLVQSAARLITSPQIQWIRYHAVDAAGGPGILFEPVAAE
jgi:hypothetical protein